MYGEILNYKNISIQKFIDFPISNKGKGVIQDRLNHLSYALNLVTQKGPILEFGVYQGTTINLISSMFPKKIIYGFDSFEGLPEDWITDDKDITWAKGHFAVDVLPKVNKNVTLIKGWFNDTLPEWIEKSKKSTNISFLHIDCDLYSSTNTVLSLLNNKIASGTIIVFDELYHFGNPKKYSNWHNGEYKALTEWMKTFDREVEIISRNRHMQAGIKVIK